MKALEFSHYALIQIGHAVYGVGVTVDEARENAAECDGMADTNLDRVPEFWNLVAMRRNTDYGDLAIVPCTERFSDYVMAHGTTTWDETDGGICLPEELEEDSE